MGEIKNLGLIGLGVMGEPIDCWKTVEQVRSWLISAHRPSSLHGICMKNLKRRSD